MDRWVRRYINLQRVAFLKHIGTWNQTRHFLFYLWGTYSKEAFLEYTTGYFQTSGKFSCPWRSSSRFEETILTDPVYSNHTRQRTPRKRSAGILRGNPQLFDYVAWWSGLLQAMIISRRDVGRSGSKVVRWIEEPPVA